MIEESIRLKNLIEDVYERYHDLDESFCSIQLTDDKWSVKEIFGHLVDSAANNYQRFVRLQETEELQFPGYDYNWVKIIRYNSFPYDQLLELWKQYNLLICHIFTNIQDAERSHVWLYDTERLTLEFLVKDYIDHMLIHHDQLAERIREIGESPE